ncbi:MAG: fibronectin type III domain-containing protein [Gammaproteobacteria bacterium AqS3]|nr:fibronectin type III domain-containing protein [Gammaproteobacteria bacterium AqS3]
MDSEAKKLFKSKAWAIDSPSNRADMDDPNVTPQIDRAKGWDDTYSQQNGNLPDRRHFNQVLCETSAAAIMVKDGVSQWDNEVDYPVHGITNVKGVLWRAKVATGPTTSNAVSPSTPNQNVWEMTSGSQDIPDAPEAFQGTTPAYNVIVAQWKAGEDNGAKILRWQFQIAPATNDDWSVIGVHNTAYPYISVSGLEPDTQYKVRARAQNLKGWGPWGYSAVGATGFTTTGTVPDGGNILALLATAGDADVDLVWAEPNNGGYSITRYVVQWALASGAWDENQETSVTGLSTTITSLTNGQEYQFRVKAANKIGSSAWSNIAKATPVSTVTNTYNPDLSAPTLSVKGTTVINAQPNETPSAIGKTAAITNYLWQIRQQGHANWGSNQSTTSKSFDFENLEANTTYEVRYSVTTSIGTTTPSSSSLATTNTAATPIVNYVQPTLLAPSVTHGSNNRVSVSARHKESAESLYTINSAIWQYRRAGASSWTTYSATNRSVSISNLSTGTYAYEFRFAYKTTGGTTAFSPIARLSPKILPPRVSSLSLSIHKARELAGGGGLRNTENTIRASFSGTATGFNSGITNTQVRYPNGSILSRNYYITSAYINTTATRAGGSSSVSVSVRYKNAYGWGSWTTKSISNLY